MPDPNPLRPLTPRQTSAMRLFITEGELTEGAMVNQCWPFISRPRIITNALLAKGLVTLGSWWDEGTGYELRLTDAGRAVVEGLRDA